MHTSSQAQLRQSISTPAWTRVSQAPSVTRNASAERGYGQRIVVRRGEMIFCEGDDAAHIYRLVSGSVRLCRISEEGERQICDFLLPGDFVGLSNADIYTLSAEAIEDCSLIKYSRSAVASMVKEDAAFACELQQVTATGLQSAYEHMVRLCRRSARDRVAWFLLAMAKRSPSDNCINLPMSRVDIADYLGMAHETVSRVFTQLKNAGAIAEINLNRIQLLKLKPLEA